MSKTVLAEVEGFTPIMDIIVQEVGLVQAAVFGRIWRYCQMRDGVCKASLEKIGGEIGLSRKTVQRHAQALCEAGYLEDLTPDLRNRPHIYVDTGKVQLQITAQAKINGRSESPTKDEEVGQRVHRVGQKVRPGRSESPMNIQEERKKKQQHVAVSSKSSSKKPTKKPTITPKEVAHYQQQYQDLHDKITGSQEKAAYNALVAAGVDRQVALRFADEIEHTRVRQVCLAAELKEGIEDKAAWIVAALNNGWAVRVPAGDERSKTKEDRMLEAGQYRVRNPRTGEWEDPPDV